MAVELDTYSLHNGNEKERDLPGIHVQPVSNLCFGSNLKIGYVEVEKEPEIEIGFPTDIKHVAHIGWDGPSDTGPGWMNEFKTMPNFSATSIGNFGSALSPWSSQDFGSMRQKSGSEIPTSEVAGIRKKQKRKRSKSTSSSQVPKSKSKFVEGLAKPTNIEVA